MTHDAVVVGAGPAGCVAATVLARAGARVLLLDRAVFPRHKLCGDTVNPGALSVLRRLHLWPAGVGLVIDGMLVSGPTGARVAARYPAGLEGRAILRRDLDYALLRRAAEAGAKVEEGVLVQRAVLNRQRGCRDDRMFVDAIVTRSPTGRRSTIQSRLFIAADGRHSRLARDLGLARHPRWPRRWAVGAYFTDVSGMTTLGEMHVRKNHYIGVAPLPGGLVNACVVSSDRDRLRDPRTLLLQTLHTEPELRERFESACMVSGPVMLGPLAVDCAGAGMPGLLLAGDAAGFIDPITGDGLRFALRGAELAAMEGLRTLDDGSPNAHVRLAARRAREFQGKWRFNRAVRRLVGSARAVGAASFVTRYSSWPLSLAIDYAGDLRTP